MKREMCMGIIAGAALASSAMAQFRVTPGGANANDGQYGTTAAIPTSLTGTGQGSSFFRPTTTASTDSSFQSWWWFRPGTQAREYAFGNAAADGLTSAGVMVGTNDGTLNSGGYDFTVSGTATFTSSQRWTISAGAAGPSVIMSNVITNTGQTELAISLFAYNDFDVAGLTSNNFSYNGTMFTISNTTAPTTTVEWEGFGQNAYQEGPFSSTRLGLADTLVTNLNNTLAASPGDFSGGFQWNLVIPANGSATVSSTFRFVPAPGALALLGLGGLAAARRRRV